jgi:hypothetical protein
MVYRAVLCFAASGLLIASAARCQDYGNGISAVHADQEAVVEYVHLQPAASDDSKAAIAAAVATIINNPKVCCGENSSLGATPVTDERVSLRDLGNKIGGRHVLSDGRYVNVTANYIPAGTLSSDQIIFPLTKQQPMLMMWKSHVYVLYGALFDDTIYTDGHHDYAIRKLLLLDPAAAEPDRKTAFDRQKDDWSQVEGLLLLKVAKS